MRVAVVSDMIRPNGAGVMVLAGAKILADSNIEVGVFAGSMRAELQANLGQTYEVAASFTHDERALDGSVTDADHHAFRSTCVRWLRDSLEAFAPDVVTVHNCGRVLTQLELMELSRRYPVAFTMHDEWLYTDAHYTFQTPNGSVVRTFEPGEAERVIEHGYAHLFEVPRASGNFTAIGPSKWLTDRAKAVFPSLSIEHVPNAADTSLFGLQDRRAARELLGLSADVPIVLFVGSPTQPRKGFRQFESSIAALDTDAVRLVIGGEGSVATGGAESFVGPGPIRNRLEILTNNPVGDLGINGLGLVISGIDRSLVPAVYGAADVLVHPSRIDNLPTVPIEAGLCGTRCLASDVGGTRETIADVGDLFDLAEGAESLSARIAAALMDARSETVGDRQKRRDVQLARFGVEAHRASILGILQTLVTKGASHA